MSRLTKISVAEVQADRIGNALRFAREWGHVVLLKGAHTVIAAPDGRGVVLPFSNPAMATAGSGDVLTGCIAGLMVQGLTPFDAAVCGGYLHGVAGEHWRAQHGDAGMLAGDLLPLLPGAIKAVKKN
jgi:NAD(P)H-hydrate epimerase